MLQRAQIKTNWDEFGNLLKIMKTNWAAHAPSLGLTTTEEEEETTKKPSTDNKEAIDSHQVTTGQKQPQTTTVMSACVCVDVCL